MLLESLVVIPSSHHDPKIITYLVPEASDYANLTQIIKSRHTNMNL